MTRDDPDLGFTFRQLKSGDVVIRHHGKTAATLRKDGASRFLAAASRLSPVLLQQEMARLTGNYRRGNERQSKAHPRNG